MVQINKSIIVKAIFGVSVVAVTASAGVAGFAQAARHNDVNRAAALNGYGGNGGAIQAAIAAFNAAINTATHKFQTDVANCVSGLTGDANAVPGDFRADSTQAANDFSAQTASPTAFSTVTKFDQHFAAADDNLQNRLDNDSNRMISNLDRFNASRDRHNAFRQCMNTARHDFRTAINKARADLRAALRGIFH